MTAKTPAVLLSDINTLINDQTTNDITPGEVRQILIDLLDSANIKNSGSSSGIRTITASGTITADDETFLLNGASAAFNQALPSPTGNTGRILEYKKKDSTANAVGFAGHIDGVAATTSTSTVQNQGRRFKCDGTSWWIIGTF